MTSLFGSLTLEELYEILIYVRLITFRKIPMILTQIPHLSNAESIYDS